VYKPVKCINCSIIFDAIDHHGTRERKYCSTKCHYKHKRRVCTKCGNEFLKHRKYYHTARDKWYVRRDCKMCERDDANAYKRSVYV